MTEFETCMLMTMKDIKSQLGDISSSLQFVGTQLKELNENHETDWTYNMHRDLDRVGDILEKIYTIAIERP